MAARYWAIPNRLNQCAQYIRREGQKATVYVACAPRARREGTRDAVTHVNCLWVDCDTTRAIERLRAFTPQPTMVISSGYGLHAWWALDKPIDVAFAHRCLLRLQHRLEADPRCAEPARVLRPPGTLNFKGGERRPVEVVAFTGCSHTVARLVAHLPDPPQPQTPKRTLPRRDDSSLDGISPYEYVARLTGREMDRRGFIQCPWHGGGQERTPSLKVYPSPSKGWHCYAGCGGGDVYVFAARLWGLSTVSDFVEIKRRLTEVFG